MKQVSSLWSTKSSDGPQELDALTQKRPPPYMFSHDTGAVLMASEEDVMMETAMQDIRLDIGFDDHLPSSEELKTFGLVRGTPFYKRKRCRYGFAAILLVAVIAALVVVLAPAVGQSDRAVTPDKSSSSSEAATPDKAPTSDSAPTPTIIHHHDSEIQDTIAYLLDYVDHPPLTNTTSPQFLAARWMAKEDTRDVALEHPYFCQRYALAVLWFATGGDKWKHSVNFLTEAHECEWKAAFTHEDKSVVEMGVKCNQQNQVTELTLQSLDLSGRVPPELALLTKLEKLSLDHNKLTDFAPFRRAGNVPYLSLGFNMFSTALPSWLGELTDIRALNLGSCGMSGSLPDSMQDMQHLTTLALDNNALIGPIDILNEIPLLQRIYLESNALTGSLTNDFLSNLKRIQVLDLSNNEFHGHVHRGVLHREQDLKVFDMSGNSLSGTLPDFAPASSLRFFSVSNNFIEGTIPTDIHNLSDLQHLDLSKNKLSGPLPEVELSMLPWLEFLFLGQNPRLTPGPIPDFSLNTHLKELSLKDTERMGEIPLSLLTNTALELLDLENNRLTSSIPSELAELKGLEYLLLNRNDLTGTVPVELSGLGHLKVLLLDRNDLRGDIDFVCPLQLPTLVSDCSEVRCDCCTFCCDDAESDKCLDQGWLSFQIGWEDKYESIFPTEQHMEVSPVQTPMD